MAELTMLCRDCNAVEWCKQCFGKYWPDKSGNGEGCTCPLPQDGRYKPSAPERRPLPIRAPRQGELKLSSLLEAFKQRKAK